MPYKQSRDVWPSKVAHPFYTFVSINETAKKLDVRFFDYVRDRESGPFKLPSLAELIKQKAQALPT